jgi:hypothetical protein
LHLIWSQFKFAVVDVSVSTVSDVFERDFADPLPRLPRRLWVTRRKGPLRGRYATHGSKCRRLRNNLKRAERRWIKAGANPVCMARGAPPHADCAAASKRPLCDSVVVYMGPAAHTPRISTASPASSYITRWAASANPVVRIVRRATALARASSSPISRTSSLARVSAV